ncbi:MAG: restriction endonuclease [Methanothrix sp.]
MPSLSIQETQALTQLSKVVYSFLPGKAHPYSRIKIDFGIVAQEEGLGHLWQGGSKLPALQALFEETLRTKRASFPRLILRIVQEGLKYRSRKGAPITQEEINYINNQITKLRIIIPELTDPRFVSSLPRQRPTNIGSVKKASLNKECLTTLKNRFLRISQLQPHERGYAFEKFLYDLFDAYDFKPRPSFRIIGEQIDGSIEFDHQYYLIEAKWQANSINEADLLVLDGRVSGHSGIGRGIFLTCGCFSKDGIAAYQRLRPSSIFGIDGQDLYYILEKFLPLDEVIRRKIRRLVETGDFHYPVAAFITEMPTHR